jgi:phosphatidylserine/phosphatidylglycerophosphate/cardiolipin synthase-like enzyme
MNPLPLSPNQRERTNSVSNNERRRSSPRGGSRLLRAGIKLHEFKRGGQEGKSLFGSGGASLHTKAFCIDEELMFVSSFNLDPRSANLNTEMGTLVKHPFRPLSFAKNLRAWPSLPEVGKCI